MYILGISCYYHDASATLLKGGRVVAAAEEERFTRKKHDAGFPLQAIAYCLESAGISVDEVAYIAFYEKPVVKMERVLAQHLEMFPRSLKTFLQAVPSWSSEKLRILSSIKKKLKYTGDVVFIQHHLSHAASAFYTSPFEEAAVVTVDGVGEWSTLTVGYGRGNTIRLSKEIAFPHSLGLLYSTITAYLGFSVNNSEYKVMGLAAYGDADRSTNQYYPLLLETIDLKDDGSFHLDLSYFTFHYKNRMPSKKLCKLLGGAINERDAEVNQRHKNIAAALQMVTEDVLIKILSHAHDTTGSKNLVFAGGVALNSVYNGKIAFTTPFEHVWIQPNASDGGTSLGAALHVYYSLLGHTRNDIQAGEHIYYGPRYSDETVRSFLDANGIVYSAFEDDESLLDTISTLLYENNVVGWFQDGMEWGPRALGARSILANPLNPDAQQLLNEKVKHRERFRPFAPAVCDDDASTYFDHDETPPLPTSYMLMVYPVKEKWRSALPAITHVDGSGRLQIVRREHNRRYYDLIKRFGEKAGIPIVINTSFNIRGEPIVCSPYDAYRCMMGTQIDHLVIGRFIVKRADNLRDEWDSESLAKD